MSPVVTEEEMHELFALKLKLVELAFILSFDISSQTGEHDFVSVYLYFIVNKSKSSSKHPRDLWLYHSEAVNWHGNMWYYYV